MAQKESKTPFLPMTPSEMARIGWKSLDVILVTGDAYVDAPHMGVAVIGRVLADAGYRVGIVSQPDTGGPSDIQRLGEPELFWGVTGGSVDSMIANYTPSGRRRKTDDMTPGGGNFRRPDRAVIAYSNLIRRYYKKTRPIVLGGIEASLRRISHYDDRSDRVRRSILFDAKADLLVYGMAEKTILEIAAALSSAGDVRTIRGVCYISRERPETLPGLDCETVELPDHETAARDGDALARMFGAFYRHTDPVTAARLYQLQDTRYLVQNPPQPPATPWELDGIYALPYCRDVHPLHAAQGRVKALDTVRFSLTTHRGCYGECRFCAITVHQGRHVVSRSRQAILAEAGEMTRHPGFKGIISDVGGPTANMYGIECRLKTRQGACPDKGCLFPEPCKHLPVNHGHQVDLLAALRALPGVRKAFVASGVRYDMVMADRKQGRVYLENLLRHHVSGQLKIAPEHTEDPVLQLMGKPGRKVLLDFVRLFEEMKQRINPRQFLTYYLMAAHPGCRLSHMTALRTFAVQKLKSLPEQVQIFTPSPSTYSTLMYHTGKNPFTGEPLFVEKELKKKQKQKEILSGKRPRRGKP